MIAITTIVLYFENDSVRNFFDNNILNKEVIKDELVSINKSTSNNDDIYAYDNKIVMLNQNNLEIYNRSGHQEKIIEVEISKPIFESNGKYLYIAEREGKSLYLISGNHIVWQKDLEGNISNICVNKNGYVAVNLKGTAYKSVIQVFDNEGFEILTKYLSSTVVSDIALSNNNEELAVAKIDYSGITIKSIVEIIDVTKAETIKSYEAKADDLLININYHKNNLVCMYDTYINIIENGNTNELTKFDESNTLFASIDLKSSIIEVIKVPSGLLGSQISTKIINSNSKRENVFDLVDEPKEIYASSNVICFNLGTEVIFASTNGFLIKKYKTSQEIQSIVLGDSIAGILYNNEIRIINL